MEQSRTFVTSKDNSIDTGTPEVQISRNNNEESARIGMERDQIIESIISGKSVNEFNDDVLISLIPTLKELKKKFSGEKKYLEAEKVIRITKEINQKVHITKFQNKCQDKLSDVRAKLLESQQYYDFLVEEWKTKFLDLDNHIEEKITILTDEQNREIQELEEKHQQIMNSLHPHPNSSILALRAKESSLVQSEKFAQAEKIKLQADQMQEKLNETEKAKIADEQNRAKLFLIEKHRSQLKVIEQWANERSIDLSRARASDIDSAEKRISYYLRILSEIESNGFCPKPSKGVSKTQVSRKDALNAIKTANVKIPQFSSQKRVRTNLTQYRPPYSVSKKCPNSRPPLDPV